LDLIQMSAGHSLLILTFPRKTSHIRTS
jgi:hypothetical protein